ncbi:MAG: polyprenyl synthetase family protein, partial [Clostridia bacterium]|nr:polyprenyl synthetase family protein [Clostridia bacterium]
TAPVVMGLTLAGADDALLQAGREYGRNLGVAFQIVDDILDVTGNVAVLGKHTGKDAQENKCTWVSVYGLEKARADAARYTEQAVKSLAPWQNAANFLKTLAEHTLIRVQ